MIVFLFDDITLTVNPGNLPTSSTDFESFANGTVNDKGPGCTVPWTTYPYAIPSPYGSLWTTGDEWGFTGSWDQEVKNDGGNKVWRISNAVTSSGFSNQPYSPSSLLVAGATGAALYSDRGPSHTTPVAPPGARYTASSKYCHGGFKWLRDGKITQTSDEDADAFMQFDSITKSIHFVKKEKYKLE